MFDNPVYGEQEAAIQYSAKDEEVHDMTRPLSNGESFA